MPIIDYTTFIIIMVDSLSPFITLSWSWEIWTHQQGIFDVTPNEEMRGISYVFDTSVVLPVVRILSPKHSYNFNCIINMYALDIYLRIMLENMEYLKI